MSFYSHGGRELFTVADAISAGKNLVITCKSCGITALRDLTSGSFSRDMQLQDIAPIVSCSGCGGKQHLDGEVVLSVTLEG